MTTTVEEEFARSEFKLFPDEETIPVNFSSVTSARLATWARCLEPTATDCGSCACTTRCGPIGTRRVCGC